MIPVPKERGDSGTVTFIPLTLAGAQIINKKCCRASDFADPASVSHVAPGKQKSLPKAGMFFRVSEIRLCGERRSSGPKSPPPNHNWLEFGLALSDRSGRRFPDCAVQEGDPMTIVWLCHSPASGNAP